jgi:beta-galactosidase GanA
MNRLRTVVVSAFVLATGAVAVTGPSQDAKTAIPRLERRGGATQLVVDGVPFLILGGEVGNSSGESGYLAPYWPGLRALNLNTILAPVYWELMEPQEGRYDFSQVDGLVRDARANHVRLVLLWFASWKNSVSTYAPAWVKTNTARFPRAADATGRGLDILSPLSNASRDADARAFAALMRHVRETDGSTHTVLMVQVENEIGMIADARDRSDAANRLFGEAVPRALIDHLARGGEKLAPELQALWTAAGRRTSGTWEQVFGRGRATDELFTAWQFATYVQAVVAAGKAEYALPMFVNAALIRPGALPGQYPSGGPLPHLFDVWRAAAPSIDFLSPDIYFQTFAEWCRRYARSGNPLFIPEAQRSADAAVNAFYALAEHDAIGFSPFAIESASGPGAASLAESYRLLSGLAPTILAHQGRAGMAGLLPEGPEQRLPQELSLGGYVLRVSYERQAGPSLADGAVTPLGAQPGLWPAGGLVIATGQDEFLFAGIGITITFAIEGSADPVGILSAEEGEFSDGAWRHGRWLNGDQTHQGRHIRLEPGHFSVQRVKLYRYREP